jgi:hypothetical protein
MKKIVFLIIIVVVLLCACGQSPASDTSSHAGIGVLNEADAGKILMAAQPKSESYTTTITTDQYIFIVLGLHSVKLGATVKIINYVDGSSCLLEEGNTAPKDCWDIYK